MSQMDIKTKIDELRKKIHQWNYEYYALDNPSVSDHIYDEAMRELIKLENDYPEFKSLDSPSSSVGGFVLARFNKIKHETRMMSLSNAFNLDEINKFVNDVKDFETKGFVFEPKIDGLSISCKYVNGRLTQAVTRGDGVVGEVVTSNALVIKDIPKYLKDKYKDISIEVRGEVYMSNADFDNLNNQIFDLDKKFKNPRNAASGTLRNLDNKITKERNLKCFMYYVVNNDQLTFNTHLEALQFLQENNFKVASEITYVSDVNDFKNTIDFFTNRRKTLPYQIDGIVIKVNNYQVYDAIGYTSKFPKWAIAYKFEPEMAITKIIDIVLDIGRTGKVSYTAKLKPVLLDGSTISFATLHNYDFIMEKDIRINDYVKIYKAGDVIPYVDAVIREKRNGDEKIFPLPTNCPYCHSLLVRKDDEVDQRCVNDNCERIKINKIIYFTSREAMNISGISSQIIIKLFENKIIEDAFDLYFIKDKKNEILNLDILIKTKTFNNMVKAIEESKNNSLESLITAFGIKHTGSVLAKKLARHFKTLIELMNASVEDLIKIYDVGEKVALEIVNFFQSDWYKNIYQKIIKINLNTVYRAEEFDENDYQVIEQYVGKTFVITGTFSIPRNKIKSILEHLYQAKVVDSISKKVDYLLVGNNGGSKLEKARILGINIIDNLFFNKDEE